MSMHRVFNAPLSLRNYIYLKSTTFIVVLFLSLFLPAYAQEPEVVDLVTPTQSDVVGGLQVEGRSDTATPLVNSEFDVDENTLHAETTSQVVDNVKEKKIAPEPEAESAALRQAAVSTPESQTLGKYVASKVGVNNGSLKYEYPITVPPGRNGLTPDIRLTYDSSNLSPATQLGWGWAHNLPYIQRVNKKGSEKLYTENDFFSVFDGELVSQGSGVYKPRTALDALYSYQFQNNVWVVTDTVGTKYTFGSTTQSRHSDPADASKIYAWLVESIEDTNGNKISFTYTKDQGQIYPNTISYNTGNLVEVQFNRVARTPIARSYTAGFLVTTAFKIDRIDVSIAGVLTTKYDIQTNTENQISDIQVTGYESGQPTTVPKTQFLYHPVSSSGWNTAQNDALTNSAQFSSGDADLNSNNTRRHIDVNGDGLSDMLWAVRKGAVMYTDTKLRTHNGFVGGGAYTIPTSLNAWFWNDGGDVSNLQVADINGDGLADLVVLGSTSLAVYLNNGNGWNTTSPAFTYTYPNTFSTNNDLRNKSARQLLDVNGDGLSDMLWVLQIPGGTKYSVTHLGTGTGFVQSTEYTLPTTLNGFLFDEALNISSLQFADMNGDGLQDAVVFGASALNVYYNKGSGWDTTNPVTHSYSATFSTNNLQRNVNARQLIDLNGDGLSDILWVLRYGSTYHATAHLSTGVGFVSNTHYIVPSALNAALWNESNGKGDLQLADINGDGLLDVCAVVYSTSFKGVRYYFNLAQQSKLLNKIVESTNGETAVVYKSAQQQSDTNKVPFAIPVVQSFVSKDGQGQTATTTYNYLDGKYYYAGPTDKRFAGFGSVVKINPDGSKVTTKYHQANGIQGNEPIDSYAKIALPYEESVTNASNSLWERKRSTYTEAGIGSQATSTRLSKELVQRYDGTASHTDTATEYIYDQYGNVTTQTHYGVVSGNSEGTFTDTGTDKRTHQTTYTNNLTSYIVGLPVASVVKNNSDVQESKSQFAYNAAGNLLEEGKWIGGSDYATTTFTYNSQGLILSQTDALGNPKTYTYDSYLLYPATITNALTQPTTYTYDYSSGKPKTVIDPNGKATEYFYDGLDRLTSQKRTEGNGGTQVVLTRDYNTTANPQYVIDTLYRGASDTQEVRTYMDGFGREIQKKSQYENGWTTVDTRYNKQGQVEKVSLPYRTTSSSKSNPINNSNLLRVYTYDPLGRVTSETTVRGVTTSSYAGLSTRVADAEGNVKDYTNDAFQNLTEVKEWNNGTAYTTAYTYNTQDLLTGITDAVGNVRAIAYDGLGRRTQLQDLHAPSDTVYGVWNFVYNDQNLTSSTDPNGVVTSYTYDALGRQLTENANSTPYIDVVSSYDTCTNGTGYVCSIATNGATSTYTYFKQGLESTKAVVIDGTTYSIASTYNRQGHPLSVTYPNSDVVTYTYTVNSLPKTVARNGVTHATSTYGVHGKPLSIIQRNGVITTYEYDEDDLYSLSLKHATRPAGAGGPGPDVLAIEDEINASLRDATTTEEVPSISNLEDLPPEIPDAETLTSVTAVSTPQQLPIETAIASELEGVVDEDEILQDLPLATTTKSTYENLVSTDVIKAERVRGASLVKELEGKSYAEVVKRKVEGLLALSFSDEKIKDAKSDISIKIHKVERIDDGVQVYVQAWKGEKPLGFGIGGQVEIERIKIVNPPILLRDGDMLTEDPKAALVQVLVDTVTDIGKADTKIEAGKIGNTTTVVYPAAGSVSPVDGRCAEDRYQSWSSVRNSTECRIARVNEASSNIYNLFGSGYGPGYYAITRNYTLFNTSSIPDTDVILSATYALYGNTDTFFAGTEQRGHVVTANPFENNSISVVDYPSVGSVSLGVSGNTWNTAGYNNFPMNAQGLASISKTSLTKLAVLGHYDYANITPDNFNEMSLGFYFADNAGTVSDPRLTIEHTAPITLAAPTQLQTEGLVNPTNIFDETPEFSAKFNSSLASDANAYRIQVSLSTSTWSSLVWDSGTSTLASSTPPGMRTPQIAYAGLPLMPNVPHYWRIKLINGFGMSSYWSTSTASFALIPTGTLQHLSYTYDNVGNIISITDSSDTQTKKAQTFTYDDLYRLSSVTTTNVASGTAPYTHIYTYSPIGNILTLNGTPYTYTGANYANPHAATSINGTTQTYDQAGNLTNNGTWTHTWTYDNRLLSSTNGSTTTTYGYDHNDQRVKKVSGGVTTLYPSTYFEVQGATTTSYIWAGDDLIATVSGNGVATTTEYIHEDHLGSTNVTTDDTGAVLRVVDYYPFGEERISTGNSQIDRHFIGERFDEETEMSYLNARYYNGARGQFTSQDPVFWEVGQTSDGMAVLQNPQAQNSYSYALNNPIVNKDPTGRIVDTIADVGFIAYDLYRVGNAFVTGGDVGEELGYLGLDVAGATIPGATGLGVAGRVAKTGDKASDWLRAGEKNTDVYIGVKNGKDSYVGISKDVNKRATQHGDRFDSLNKVTPNQYTRNEARAMEQQIKNSNPGYQNKINSISPSRQQYQAAINWAKNEISRIQKEINKLKRR